VGGSEPLQFQPGVFGYNVIQAAAPTGVSGTITITTPALDVSAGLTPLNAKVLDTGGLGRGLCDGGSSLAQAGRGGLPPSARGLLRDEDTEAAALPTLAQLMPVSASIACSKR
jgi:large exoprotein involved in heme utilization and adhesion